MAYEINYEDQKFKDVEADKKEAISDLEKTYGGMINESDAYYKAQIDASKDWEKKQTELQNQQTDFAIQEINQKKDQAKKDYTKEQSGAYVDWQKQSNEFGAEAEQRAAQGLANTGFSESAQVSMFNTYQNRVMTARDVYNRSVQDFNNGITEARLQNNSALAEIRFNALKQQLELNLQGFQAKNQLLLDKANQKLQIEDSYYNRYQDVLNQINEENSLAEQIRQFNESMKLEREQFEWQKSNFKSYSRGGGGYRSRSSGGSAYIKKDSKRHDSINSNVEGLAKDTADSILALGQGPISGGNLGNQVKTGKVSVSTSKATGNPIYTPAKASPTSKLLFSKSRF